MLRRALPLAIALSGMACPLVAAGQAAPMQYGVCASQFNLPTIYVSGVLQGPASSAASLRAGFTQFLAQRYAYKGAVGCAPAANAAAAAKLIQDRAGALRNAKKVVIETGWTESAVPAAKLAGMLSNLHSTAAQGAGSAAATTSAAGSTSTAAGTTGAARSRAASGTSGTGSGTSSGSSSGSSELASVLASIFGGGGSSGGSGGCASGGSAKPQTGAAGSGGSDSGSGGCQSTFSQVSSALSGAFAQKPASGGASGGSQPGGSQPAHTAADGLGSAKAQNTRLVVYGCGRQDKQVACVSELTNQNQADTLMQSAELWKDTFIVDDRGDRHARSRGFFLNIDGEQRTQLDVSYGKSARFILMFDDVQARVQKVTLRSQNGGLDVEDIDLITTGAAAGAAQ